MIQHLRQLILFIVLLGIIGLGVELLLLEHFEGKWQQVPIGLLILSLLVVVFHLIKHSSFSVYALRAMMILLIIGGGIGLYLHYDGNMEFELEMEPDLSGFNLFKNTMTGATPALAPGALIQLGLLGLAATIGCFSQIKTKKNNKTE